MPFTCIFCNKQILPGEPMLTDGTDSVGHETCIRKEIANPKRPTVHLPSVTVFPPPPAPPPPQVPADRPYRNLSHPDACVPPRPTSLCDECGKPAIGMCPHCGKYVHQDYGYNGPNCSGRHETKCPGAAESRNPKRPYTKPTVVTRDFGPLKNIIQVETELEIESVTEKRSKKKNRNGKVGR